MCVFCERVCVYVYVCMYVRMYVCMYVRTYVCMYVCMYVCTYVCMQLSVLVCFVLLSYRYYCTALECPYVHMHCMYVCRMNSYVMTVCKYLVNTLKSI